MGLVIVQMFHSWERCHVIFTRRQDTGKRIRDMKKSKFTLKDCFRKEENQATIRMFPELIFATDNKVIIITGLSKSQALHSLYKQVGNVCYWVRQKKVIITSFHKYRNLQKMDHTENYLTWIKWCWC